MSFITSSANELQSLVNSGKVTPETIRQGIKRRIEMVDGAVHAYVRIFEDNLSERQETGSATCPVPIAIKDNICISDRETTCASRILQGFRPPYDATVIKKIKEQGMPIIGHTNMDEFAFGSSTEHSAYGPTRNPWDTACVPGGSSGGSTAAVAAHETFWALGSDTGGSIRQPAAFCGVVGVKPTYGRVSRYGLIAFASSLDQIGPITKTVEDAAWLLQIIAGHDPRDSTSIDRPVPDYRKALQGNVKGLRIGLPQEYFVEGLDPEIADAVNGAIDVLTRSGAKCEKISLPHTEYCVATYYIIATAEASSNLARYDGVRYGLRRLAESPRHSTIIDMFEETRKNGFGTEAKRRVMLGTYALSAGYYDKYYARGQKARTLIKQDFDRVFDEFDAIITPTTPSTAFRIGEKADDPLAMYLSDVFTISANLSGIPAMSVPCGFSRAGLPIGLQIMTKAFDEEMMLRIAYQYEQQTQWRKQQPSL